MTDEALLSLAVDIISAHVGNNHVSAVDLPQLIQTVYASLSQLGQHLPTVAEKRMPAVSIRTSVKPDAITCLECGKKFKMLKRHLSSDHQLTPAQYRARWDLNTHYPLVAPDYANMRKTLAVKIGLGRKPVAAKAKSGRNPRARGTDVPAALDV